MARQINPILTSVSPTETISDPFVRELYFGSTDTPGLIRQATDAAQKAILDQPAILQETAGLSPDEIRAREIARAGIGSFQPFLQTAEQSFGRGLGALQGSIGFGGPSARQLLSGSLRGFDPSMTGQFYNPFEEQVVQRTIDDTLRAAAQQDIAQRASDIARGGQSAFGSRARLTAEERQRGIGRGLGEALSQIRSGGFLTAQDRALQELERQREAARRGAALEQGFGQDLSAAQRLFGSDIADLGATQQRLRGIDIANLTGLGATERGIEEQRLARQFAQQQDPLAVGLGGFLSAYSAMKRPIQPAPPPPPAPNTDQGVDDYRSPFNRDLTSNPQTIFGLPANRVEALERARTAADINNPQAFQDVIQGQIFQPSGYQPVNPVTGAPQINMPSSLPAVAPTLPSFGLPPAFNVDNPGANLPYNPFAPRS
jgi:hypothetical protein